MIWQSVLVVVICYLYIYSDFSYIYYLFLLLPWLWWIKIIINCAVVTGTSARQPEWKWTCGSEYIRALCCLELSDFTSGSMMCGLMTSSLPTTWSPLENQGKTTSLVNVSEFARRSLSVAARHTWNSLLSDVRSCHTVDTFKRHLKTHLFRQS